MFRAARSDGMSGAVDRELEAVVVDEPEGRGRAHPLLARELGLERGQLVGRAVP